MSNNITSLFFRSVYSVLYLPFFLGTHIIIMCTYLVDLGKLIVKNIIHIAVATAQAFKVVINGIIKLIVMTYQSFVWFCVCIKAAILKAVFAFVQGCQHVGSLLFRQHHEISTFGTLLLLGVLAGLTTSATVVSWEIIEHQSYPQTVTAFAYPHTLTVSDRSGVVLYEAYTLPASLPDESSSFLNIAAVALFDPTFYSHTGVDWNYVLTTFFGTDIASANLHPKTITHQLANRLADTSQYRQTRIIQEILLTLKLEAVYSKDQLLQIYLATTPVGTSIGIKNAAAQYFNVQVDQLTPDQALYLLALLKTDAATAVPVDHEQVTSTYRTFSEILAKKNIASSPGLGTVPVIQTTALRIKAVNAVSLAVLEAEQRGITFDYPTNLQSSVDSVTQTQLQQLIIEQFQSAPQQIPQAAVLITNRYTGEMRAFTGPAISSVIIKHMIEKTEEKQESPVPVHALLTSQPTLTTDRNLTNNELSDAQQFDSVILTTGTTSFIVAIWVDPTAHFNHQFMAEQIAQVITDQLLTFEKENSST
jgi:hypothetical protein